MDPSAPPSLLVLPCADLNKDSKIQERSIEELKRQQPGHLAPHFSENHCVAQKNCLPARGFPPRFQAIFLSGRSSKLPGAAFSPWVPFFFCPRLCFLSRKRPRSPRGTAGVCGWRPVLRCRRASPPAISPAISGSCHTASQPAARGPGCASLGGASASRCSTHATKPSAAAVRSRV